MGLKEKFLLSLKGESKTFDHDEDDYSYDEANEQNATEEECESVLDIVSEYEKKQMGKFVEQLQTMSEACYHIKNTILPTLDGELLKTIYNENEEEFTSVLDTIDEILNMIKTK